MAVVKLGSTPNASRVVNYNADSERHLSADGASSEILQSAVNCDVGDVGEVAEQFSHTRGIYGKNDGVQAHIVYQSFEPHERSRFDGREITPQECHEIGFELAKRIESEGLGSKAVGKGHEIFVVTHCNKGHLHNHIVINSVSPVDGRKYHSTRDVERAIKALSDELCASRGFQTIEDIKGKCQSVQKTSAELGVEKRANDAGQSPSVVWKNSLRVAIDEALSKPASGGLPEVFKRLEEQGITVASQTKSGKDKKHVTFTDLEGHKARGSSLGDDYTLEGLSRRVISPDVEAVRTKAKEEPQETIQAAAVPAVPVPVKKKLVSPEEMVARGEAELRRLAEAHHSPEVLCFRRGEDTEAHKVRMRSLKMERLQKALRLSNALLGNQPTFQRVERAFAAKDGWLSRFAKAAEVTLHSLKLAILKVLGDKWEPEGQERLREQLRSKKALDEGKKDARITEPVKKKVVDDGLGM